MLAKENYYMAMEAPGFSPAKSHANKSGFSRGGPGLKPLFYCCFRHG
jgi:hypothetical protein